MKALQAKIFVILKGTLMILEEKMETEI